jgi:ABC-type branched-subunit amino acid transport system substrate-binding protein
MEQQGISNFAILYPNDAYGTEFANIFWDEVVARGGKIRAVQIYSPKETDFRLVIQRLIGTFYLEDRIDEMQTLLAEQKKDPKKSKSKFEGGNKEKAPEDLLEPVVGFQAIFIPDSVKALGQIAAMLSYNNVKGIKLLGTNLWNSSQLNKRAGAFSESIFFVDSSIDTTTSKPGFIRDYKNLFKEDPGLIEVQAYDSALMIKQLVSNGYSSRESLAQGLSALNQFPGGIGSITATEERDFLRPMTVLTLLNGQIVPSSDNRVRP